MAKSLVWKLISAWKQLLSVRSEKKPLPTQGPMGRSSKRTSPRNIKSAAYRRRTILMKSTSFPHFRSTFFPRNTSMVSAQITWPRAEGRQKKYFLRVQTCRSSEVEGVAMCLKQGWYFDVFASKPATVLFIHCWFVRRPSIKKFGLETPDCRTAISWLWNWGYSLKRDMPVRAT